jgi:hypothetical protein
MDMMDVLKKSISDRQRRGSRARDAEGGGVASAGATILGSFHTRCV